MIASSVGGVPEIVTHGVNGMLYRSGDVSGFASCVETLCDASARAPLAAAARASCERFSLRRMVGAYVALIASLTGERTFE